MSSTSRRISRLLAGGAVLLATCVAPLQAASAPDHAGAVPTGVRAAAVQTDACGPVRLKPNGNPWRCSFVDHFAGTTLDLDKWSKVRTRDKGFRSGLTCYTDSPRNVWVRDGLLHLSAVKGSWIRCRNPLRSFSTRYTGGGVGTRGNFSQTYGKFEVRAAYPDVSTPGVHGGFWMYPLNHTYGAWPASGELDVAEWWSVDATLALPSLHYNGRDYEVDSGWECRVADPSRFHDYTVEWQRSGVRFFIDGALCWERSWDPDAPLRAPQPFDHPFNMNLTMGVGPSTGVNQVSSETPFPATYVVAYAKAWR